MKVLCFFIAHKGLFSAFETMKKNVLFPKKNRSKDYAIIKKYWQ
jgi:hypothetical protein